MSSRGRNPHRIHPSWGTREPRDLGEIFTVLGNNKSMPEWQQNMDLLRIKLDLPSSHLRDLAQDLFTSTGWDPSSPWDISGFSEFLICFSFQNLGSGLLQFLFKLLEGKRLNVFGSIAKMWSCAAWGICFLLSRGLPWNLKTPGCATLIYKHSKQYKSLKIKAVLLSLQSRSFFKELLMQKQNHLQLVLWSFYSCYHGPLIRAGAALKNRRKLQSEAGEGEELLGHLIILT